MYINMSKKFFINMGINALFITIVYYIGGTWLQLLGGRVKLITIY